MQEMHSKRPKFSKFSWGAYPRTPLESLHSPPAIPTILPPIQIPIENPTFTSTQNYFAELPKHCVYRNICVRFNRPKKSLSIPFNFLSVHEWDRFKTVKFNIIFRKFPNFLSVLHLCTHDVVLNRLHSFIYTVATTALQKKYNFLFSET